MNKDIKLILGKLTSLSDSLNQLKIVYDLPLDVKDASEFLKLKPGTIYALVNKGSISYYKSKQKIYFKRADLQNYAFCNRVASVDELAEKINREGK